MADRRVRVILEAQIAQFQSAMRQARESTGQIAGDAKTAEREYRGMGTTIMGRVVPAVAGLVTGQQIFNRVFRAGFDRLATLEQAEQAFRQMGLSTEQVTGLMQSLNETVTDTPFRLDDGAAALARFVSAGMPLEDIPRNFELMADAAAFASATTGDFAGALRGLTEIWERIQTEGRLTGETLRMLQVRGVPALELLASAAGTTGAEMREMISRGEIDAARFFDLWETGAQGFGENNIRMAGAAKSSGDTIRGAMENAQTAFARLGAEILDDFMPAIRAGFDGLREQINDVIAGWNFLTDTVRTTAEAVSVLPWVDLTSDEQIEKERGFWENLLTWSKDTTLGVLGNITGIGFAWELRNQAVERGKDVDREAGESTSWLAEQTEKWTAAGRGAIDRLRELHGGLAETEEAFDQAAHATEAATDALSAYQSELKAATDPVFALTKALEGVEQAEGALAEARKEHGENSAEAAEAEWALFQALVNADSAAHNAELSFAGVNAVLDDMVQRNLITEETADRLREQIGATREAAEQFQGPYTAELLAEIDDPAIREAARRLDILARVRNPQYLAEVDRQEEIRARNRLDAMAAPRHPDYRPGVNSGARSRTDNSLNTLARRRDSPFAAALVESSRRNVESGLNTLARPRTAHITVTYGTQGEIPAGFGPRPRGHAGGLVTRSGIMPRMHGGGQVLPRFHDGASIMGERLASDEVPAILQTRERVLSREQNSALEMLLRTLGNTSMVGPFFHAGGVVSGGGAMGGSTSPTAMSRAIAREVGRAINGATLVIDDRGNGRLIARRADLQGRAG